MISVYESDGVMDQFSEQEQGFYPGNDRRQIRSCVQ